MFKDISYLARVIAVFMAVTCRDVATVHPPSNSNHMFFWMVFGKGLWMFFIYLLTLSVYVFIKDIFIKQNH